MKKILAFTFLLSASFAANAAQTWFLFGDSIMSEVFPSTVDGPFGKAMEMAANRIQMERDVNIRNFSSPGKKLGGDTFSFKDGVTLMKTTGGVFNYYQGVIVQVGTNDYHASVKWQDTVASLIAIIDEAARLKKKVLVMDPIWRRGEESNNALGWTLGSYRWQMAMTCNKYPGTCFWATRTGTVFDNSGASALYNANEVRDGKELHLNAEGHRRYADWVMKKAAEFKLF